MSRRLPGRPSSISATRRVPPSARVSTSGNTKPIHDPPAGNGPAGHIAPSAHPQSLDTPAGHHQPLRIWVLCLYFMGLNLSNRQIAAELGLGTSEVQLMTEQVR